jgi:hypothetical protein
MYGWIITKDHLGDGEEGIMGPSWITPDMSARLKAGEGEPFRLFDDDGELYYTGRAIDCYEGEPLWDFGAPNAGCTYMEEKVDGKWEITVG